MAEFNEFELIEQFFAGHDLHDDVVLGVGDDGAVVEVPADRQLVIALDTLNEGVHFLAGTDPADTGYKALAVNLSDLAAMGAVPAWFTLALSLPQAQRQWLEGFSQGLYAAAKPYGMALIGGDTTRGARSITIQAGGYVERGRFLRRGGAAPGDAVYVTGWLGDAALGLQVLQGRRQVQGAQRDYLLARHCRPPARVAEGRQLAGLASACIDISDGLAADLGHIAAASAVGARIELEALPASPAMRAMIDDAEQRYPLMLGGGEDYELCLCVPPGRVAEFETLSRDWEVPVTRIGEITRENGIRFIAADGTPRVMEARGFDHFASETP